MLKRYILVVLIAFGCTQAKANPTEHFVAAGLGQAVGYVFMHKAFHITEKPIALVFSAVAVTGFAAIAEYDKPRANIRTFGAAMLGIATSSLCILVIDF